MQDSKQQPSEYQIPVNPEELVQPPKWAIGTAGKEERQWDELEEVRRKNDKRWLEHYGRIVVILTWVFVIMFVASLVTWVWHHIAPEYFYEFRLYWLDDAHLSNIQSILFSGGMGAVVFGVVKSQLDKAK